MAYSFYTIIASRGYHVYKETSWSNAKVGDDYFVGWKTVGHIPRKISRYVYFFIKQEGGKVNGKLNSLKYKASPILSGGLEVPLSLKFKCDEKWVLDAMEEFVDNFYSYDFAGNLVNDEDEDDESVDLIQSLSKKEKSLRIQAVTTSTRGKVTVMKRKWTYQ